jgi:hypothetical protein
MIEIINYFDCLFNQSYPKLSQIFFKNNFKIFFLFFKSENKKVKNNSKMIEKMEIREVTLKKRFFILKLFFWKI